MVGNANEKASMSVVSDAPRCHGKIGSGRESGKATQSVVRCSVLNATEKSVVPEERLMEEKVCSDFTARMGPVRFAPPFPSLPPPLGKVWLGGRGRGGIGVGSEVLKRIDKSIGGVWPIQNHWKTHRGPSSGPMFPFPVGDTLIVMSI